MTRTQICSKAGKVRAAYFVATFEERFWKRINKNGPTPKHRPELGPCWLWTGSVNGSGYGQVKRGGKAPMAHRVAFELTGRAIPDGKQLLHHCDTPRCCNPSHCFPGTPMDNVHDCMKKGRRRHPRGEEHYYCKGSSNGRAKLTEATIKEIRKKHRGFGWCKKLAGEYGVSAVLISGIVRHKFWSHVP